MTQITLILLHCSDLVKSILTLFRLFTLDHWFEILNDLGKTSNNFFSKAYIVLWICVGAFIFKNVFTGIMGKQILCVLNFKSEDCQCDGNAQIYLYTQGRDLGAVSEMRRASLDN